MTVQAKIEALRELRERATKGPWRNEGMTIWHENGIECVAGCHAGLDALPSDNAAFIVAIVNNAEALLEIAEALQGAVHVLAEGCCGYRGDDDPRAWPEDGAAYGAWSLARAALAKLAGGSE